uniref:Uncharacterized protein n=1 Tax=Calcidiscus leptoporus TaxID=127549 RepID=A0A7S0P643_9EUKA|mmetsp:Transcript_7930/g.18560  ORF Transcript_7930/g.18560 Transcript_7930/m.18560 type:complete len:100 (+) Transcript_7930:138-437(+)
MCRVLPVHVSSPLFGPFSLTTLQRELSSNSLPARQAPLPPVALSSAEESVGVHVAGRTLDELQQETAAPDISCGVSPLPPCAQATPTKSKSELPQHDET